jgi:phasin family protein
MSEHDQHQAASNAQASVSNASAAMGRTMSEFGASAMSEFSRLFSEIKMPAVPDLEALMAAHRRNLETLSAANRVALEGAQAVARRNMEIMQQTMAELTESMRNFASNEGPQARASRQADMLKAAYERAISNMSEISDLIQKSNGEALALLNRRFSEAMDEVKALASKTTPGG